MPNYCTYLCFLIATLTTAAVDCTKSTSNSKKFVCNGERQGRCDDRWATSDQMWIPFRATPSEERTKCYCWSESHKGDKAEGKQGKLSYCKNKKNTAECNACCLQLYAVSPEYEKDYGVTGKGGFFDPTLEKFKVFDKKAGKAVQPPKGCMCYINWTSEGF